MNESAPDLIGKRIDNYEVLEVLGEGGFATVYSARHVLLGRKVALKLLNAEYRNERDVLERFLEEGRIQANLKHPAIVLVTEIVSSPPCLVMEFVNGRTLRKLLQDEGRLTPERAVALLLPVLEGLACAHAANVVHRDL